MRDVRLHVVSLALACVLVAPHDRADEWHVGDPVVPVVVGREHRWASERCTPALATTAVRSWESASSRGSAAVRSCTVSTTARVPWVRALRLGLPLSFALIGAKAESCSDRDFLCGLSGAAAGLLFGGLVAMTIDDFALAHEDVPARGSSQMTPTVSWVRSLDGRSSSPSFGVTGVF
jgi:hypothetical protein